MRGVMKPRVQHYQTPVREAAPQAIAMAVALKRRITSVSLRGSGAIIYGYPDIGTRTKFAGYANTPQLFLGYSPSKVAAGAFRGSPGALPSTSSPATILNSPLQRSMAAVTDMQLGGS